MIKRNKCTAKLLFDSLSFPCFRISEQGRGREQLYIAFIICRYNITARIVGSAQLVQSHSNFRDPINYLNITKPYVGETLTIFKQKQKGVIFHNWTSSNIFLNGIKFLLFCPDFAISNENRIWNYIDGVL